MKKPTKGTDRPRVLLVDDDKETCVLLQSFLEEDGIEVLGAALDGLLAAQMVDQLMPDVVVMDRRMPGMDGIEAAGRIRAAHPEVEVLMLTFQDEQEPDRLTEAGTFDYLLKGCPPSLIADGVRRAWRVRHPE